jgi:TPR repeat protein
MLRRLFRFSLVALAWLVLSTGVARSDTLDDSLQTVWESLWGQEGTPQFVSRWKKAVTYRIDGHEAARHRAHIESALQGAAQAAGISMTDVGDQPGAQATAMLNIEVMKDDGLPDNLACYAQALKWNAGNFEKMQIKMRSRDAWRCTFHEVMHAMGVSGHPSGKTVLSYFPYRRDVFMALDLVMLKAWYSDAMPVPATPLQALKVLSDAVVRDTDHGVPIEQAIERARAFSQRALKEMEALATGTGEVPAIVLRSGRASSRGMTAARGLAAYFVALTHEGGSGQPADSARSGEWFERSAKLGYSAGQLMWARALKNGKGVVANRDAAYGWFLRAHAGGHPFAAKEIQAIEKTMSLEEIEKLRAQPAPALEPS